MGRIQTLFERLKAEGRSAFIPYLCAGDPDMKTCLNLARGLFKDGVDLLEVGVPFSDPLADGLTNQLAAQRALEAGASQEAVFGLVRTLREETETPIVFYTYYNLVHAMGAKTYVEVCREAGVDGLLVLDLPPEEADELIAAAREAAIDLIFIIAPTTRPERMTAIAERATGFLYYVSREGVTGEQTDLAEDLGDSLEEIRRHTDLPVVVGFGISSPEQVDRVGQLADGVVVGSSLVRCIQENADAPEEAVAAYRDKARWLMEGLK